MVFPKKASISRTVSVPSEPHDTRTSLSTSVPSAGKYRYCTQPFHRAAVKITAEQKIDEGTPP